MKSIVILGSTGSIGTQTLEVAREQMGRFRIHGLVGGRNGDLLIRQALEFRPVWVGLSDAGGYRLVREALPPDIEVVSGESDILDRLSEDGYDMLVAAISGIAGLKSTIAGIRAGKDIALANKETLVAGGQLILDMVREMGVSLLPVDSEHSAIFQSIGTSERTVKKIILTASGGPFRDLDEEAIKTVGLEDALKHPNWSMGKKITIDSATLANKALEVIEAHYLFDCPYEDIDVLVHKESIIHSMVEFVDTSVIAQLGYPSMKLPILYALAYPESLATPWPSLDLATIGNLNFSRPKPWFKALTLGYAAGKTGGAAPIVFNGANEAAVELFLQNKIDFMGIADRIERALESVEQPKIGTFDDIAQVDEMARRFVMETL